MVEEKKGLAATDVYGKIGVGVVIAILLSGCTGQFATATMQPVMALIGTTWPEYAHISYLPMSLMSLFMVPPVIFMGLIARYISKKSILMFGSSLFFLGGVIPLFVDGFWVYVVCKCLIGLSVGIVVALPTTMINFLFQGKRQNTLLGTLNAVAGGIAAVSSTIVGLLAVTSLQSSNWVYFLMLIIVILQGIFIPKFPPEKKDTHIPKVDEFGNKIKIGGKTVASLICFFIWKIIAIGFIYAMASSVIRMGGGMADAGFVTSTMTVCNLIWSFAFIFFFAKMKNFVIPFGCLASALSWLMLSIGTSVGYMYAWAILCSLGMTMFYPWYWKTMGMLAPKVWITTAVAFISVGSYLGQSLAAYVMQFIGKFTSGEAQTYMVYFIIMVVYAIIAFFIMLKDKKSGNQIFKNLGEVKTN